MLSRLGEHKASVACLYVTRLSQIDRDVLRELLELSLAQTTDAALAHPTDAAGTAI